MNTHHLIGASIFAQVPSCRSATRDVPIPFADASTAASIGALRQRWLERAVLGLNLCSFAGQHRRLNSQSALGPSVPPEVRLQIDSLWRLSAQFAAAPGVGSESS